MNTPFKRSSIPECPPTPTKARKTENTVRPSSDVVRVLFLFEEEANALKYNSQKFGSNRDPRLRKLAEQSKVPMSPKPTLQGEFAFRHRVYEHNVQMRNLSKLELPD